MTPFVRSMFVAVALAIVTARANAGAPARAVPAVDEHVGARLPLGAAFTTSDGKRVTLGDFFGNGQPGLLVLSYAHCAMLCGVVLRGVSDLLRDYRPHPGERFTLVNVSIDPRETPHEAARIRASTLARAGDSGVPARAAFLVGERRSIDAVANAVGFRYAWDPPTAQYAHPAVMFVISPKGEVTRYFYGLRFEPEEVRAALFGGPPPLARSLKTAVLACFRSDVLERRYGGVIARAFQLGGLLVLAALGGLLLFFVKRGRSPSRERRRSP